MSAEPLLTAADLEQLAAAGIGEDEARGQLARLLEPPRPSRLVRPATAGDGVLRVDPTRVRALRELAERARDDGRLTKFVPASGAATRMFRSLAAIDLDDPGLDLEALGRRAALGDELAEEATEILSRLAELALSAPWAAALGLEPETLAERARTGPLGPLVAALVGPQGLDAASLPKARLPFHEAAEGPRTAFVEQLVEGIGYLRDADGLCRHHFTVPPGSRDGFDAELLSARELLARRNARAEVGFSEQETSTHTLALGPDLRPARHEDGTLLLRPAGHGALLANLGRLAAAGADLVVIKNIDNVQPESRHPEIVEWKLLLVGLLVELEARLHELGSRLAAGDLDREALVEAVEWAGATFGRRPPRAPRALPDGVLADHLADALARPLRVCGVVPNTGEPGGGPFWTLGADGVETPQIVESAQVDSADVAQQAIWRSSTHFN
ncbi:MAG: DUF4301 family protein, partial [Acidobacteria bacterium]|nr:DUF4301 family protein [Acidobacteriota bacterium]